VEVTLKITAAEAAATSAGRSVEASYLRSSRVLDFLESLIADQSDDDSRN
jgi:hypothetical protein